MTKEEFEDWKDENRGDFYALRELAEDNGNYDLFDDLISTDDVDDFVRERLDNSGWQGVACCISDIIECMNEEFYEIDGYGNLTMASDWDSYADDLEDSLDLEDDDDRLICDICEEHADTVMGIEEWIDEENIDDDDDRLSNVIRIVDNDSNRDYCEDCWEELKYCSEIFLQSHCRKVEGAENLDLETYDSFIKKYELNKKANFLLRKILENLKVTNKLDV